MIPGLTPQQSSLVIETIQHYFPDASILFFGSRVTGKHKKTSDLDVCIKQKSFLDLANWSKLEEDFSQSDLPFKIDLIDWNRVTPEFQSLILKNSIQAK